MEKQTIDEYFAKKPNKEEFHSYLYSLMDEKGLEGPDIYKKAGIDRKTWSKIISSSSQRPTKRTVVAIAISMELDYRQCKHLVKAAGYILNRDTFDLVIRYCIDNKIYDPFKVDELLAEKGQKPLFSL